MNNDIVKMVLNGVKLHDTIFIPLTPDPVINLIFSLAKIGKAAKDVAAAINFPPSGVSNLIRSEYRVCPGLFDEQSFLSECDGIMVEANHVCRKGLD